MCGELAPGAASEDLQSKSKEEVFEYLQVPLYGLAAHLCFAGYVREIEHGGMTKAHSLQKPRERTDVAYQAFLLHFFMQIKCVVRLEYRYGIVGSPDDRQHALAERSGKLEARTQLDCQVGVHQLLRSASPEQIDPFTPKLPGTRGGEDKLLPGLFLDQEVHYFEQRRQLLDLVDDNVLRRGVCADHFDEVLGGSGIAAENGRIEEIDPQSIRVLMDAPRCLASSAWPQKKVVVATD